MVGMRLTRVVPNRSWAPTEVRSDDKGCTSNSRNHRKPVRGQYKAEVSARHMTDALLGSNSTIQEIDRKKSREGDGQKEVVVVEPSKRSFVQQVRDMWQSSTDQVHEDVKAVDSQKMNKQIKEMARQLRVMAIVLPFAATSGVHSLILITKAISSFINVYLLLLFVRVLLSWFPTFKWDRNPWIILRQVTDPYLNLFRGLVPPLLGTIDFTPLLGFFILQWLAGSLTVSDQEFYW